jgi:hypothetical protein
MFIRHARDVALAEKKIRQSAGAVSEEYRRKSATGSGTGGPALTILARSAKESVTFPHPPFVTSPLVPLRKLEDYEACAKQITFQATGSMRRRPKPFIPRKVQRKTREAADSE